MTAGAAARTAALRRAAAWGVSPQSVPDATDPLLDRVVRAGAQLRARLAAAPAPSGPPDTGELARAVATLASATGRVAVLSRLRRDALPALAQLSGGPAALDAAWLTVTASVREPLARLEALQLDPPGAAPLAGWCNRAADPWQANAADERRMVAAYAPPALDLAAVQPSARLAVALVDRFSETIPATGHTAMAAFGFDAPAARAPQAILLAVPPEVTQPLDTATIVAIVAETRELARARMARPRELRLAGALLPTVLLPQIGNTATPLDPQPFP